ncbi:hypothetical protein GCK72_025697 [Caenorhabditis remanei]|nr:hypothetical protein GCK72_025697 [Caenorhabditis remanei]KAF1749230.1 hypothetical protein GCK72_025697 [Caenorhabditis remanei]
MDVSGSINYTPNPIVMNLFHPEQAQESRTPKFFEPAALNQGTTQPPNQSCGPETFNSNTTTEAPALPRATNAPSGTNCHPEAAAMEWSHCGGR